MEIYFIFILIVLFILAISDLIFGVANDAVNFLNSAIGSKVAPRHIILIFASVGILIGVLLSGGMMEVARKGLFNPHMFTYPEVMAIFVAVMFADVLLLDMFNTFGLPTSTTVSIIFSILGASFAMASINTIAAHGDLNAVLEYINTDRAFLIISGIFLSVIISFIIGSIVQFIVRGFFTFNYRPRLKYFGGIFSAIALTSLTYFIFTKGINSSMFKDTMVGKFISAEPGNFIFYSLGVWFVIFQSIILIFPKINILKSIVIVGTGSLALAFAANDLVNFIGVPLAGFNAFEAVQENPNLTNMDALNQPIGVNFFFLLGAGVIMAATIWFSKKANTVTKTEVNLASEQKGKEKFKKSFVAKGVVNLFLFFSGMVRMIIPGSVLHYINSRFDKNLHQPHLEEAEKKAPFDLLRAAVNLVVASSLISFATSLKLPLSTTFVTFIVAMGTSFSDRAWGKENAVNRVNGVLTVVGGWFLTAIIAFCIAFIFLLIIHFGGSIAVVVMTLGCFVIIYKTHIYHKQKENKEKEKESVLESHEH